MCFSATASFTAGALLLGVGAITVPMARERHELPFAAIPLLFGIQQVIEGFVWLSFGWGRGEVTNALAQAYSFFSHVLWPAYVPAAAWLMERQAGRRQLLAAMSALSLAVALYLLYMMFADPITAAPVGGHVEYGARHLYAPVVMLAYLAATTISLMLSSRAGVRVFGFAACAAFVLAYAFYARWFISVWCFFAAVLSVMVTLHLRSASRVSLQIQGAPRS